MVGEPTGGRVLVVVPDAVGVPDWEGGADGTGGDGPPDDGTFVRGETADATGSDGLDSDDEPDSDGGSDPTGGEAQSGDTDGGVDRGSTGSDDSNGSDRGEDGDDSGTGGDDPDGSDAAAAVERILTALEDRLPAEIVVRCPETYAEYVEELGPTLDCVVVLEDDRSLIEALIEDGSVPTVIHDPPVIGTVDGDAAGDDPIGALVERIRSEIQEDRLVSDLQESNARLAALSRYAEDITACETTGAVARRTIDATTEALAFDHAVVFLVEGDRLVPRASALPDPAVSATDLDDGIAGRTLAAGESEIVVDMQTDPDAVPEHDDLHAVLSVPIGDRGVIQIAAEVRDAFDDRDVEFVEILAGISAEALERIEREVTLRRERDRLHALFDELPAPAVYVERDAESGGLLVEETNAAYDDRFGLVDCGASLRAIAPSDAEIEQYEAALGTGGVSTGRIERDADGDGAATFALTVVSVSLPDGHEGAYGIYVDPADAARLPGSFE